MDIKSLLFVSMVLQIIGAGRSIYLIKVTGVKCAWVCLSAAFVFMAVRRALSLINVVNGADTSPISYENEVIGLILSVFLVIGVFGIGPIFREWRASHGRIAGLLEEKELLLKEVHHRIKNNMNVISSLLTLQSDAVPEPGASALRDAAGRVASMTLLYDKVYRLESYESVHVEEYLAALVDEIVAAFPNREGVVVEKNLEDFRLPFRGMYEVGIVMNEIVTNAMKHAFVSGAGTLRIIARIEGEYAWFSVEDDGVGLPIEAGQSGGFGMTLVRTLMESLGGELQVESGRGTRVSFSVPLPKETPGPERG